MASSIGGVAAVACAELCKLLRGSLLVLFECVFVPEGESQRIVTDHRDGIGWLRVQSPSGKLSPKR